MMGENAYLTEAQARHLTVHGISRNEDGTWSWKFDNYLNVWPAFDMPHGDIAALWGAITCPTLLLYGANSWASNPERDGRLEHFSTAKRSEEHTSELQSLMRISYAVFCLKKKKN